MSPAAEATAAAPHVFVSADGNDVKEAPQFDPLESPSHDRCEPIPFYVTRSLKRKMHGLSVAPEPMQSILARTVEHA